MLRSHFILSKVKLLVAESKSSYIIKPPMTAPPRSKFRDEDTGAINCVHIDFGIITCHDEAISISHSSQDVNCVEAQLYL